MGRCLHATTSSMCLFQGAPCNVANTRLPAFECRTLGMPSSMKHSGKTMPLTIAAPTMVPGLRWLGSLMPMSGSRSVRGLQPPTSDCSGAAQCNSSGRTSRRRTPHASGPKASNDNNKENEEETTERGREKRRSEAKKKRRGARWEKRRKACNSRIRKNAVASGKVHFSCWKDKQHNVFQYNFFSSCPFRV